MKNIFTFSAVLIFLITLTSFAQSNPPKRELRAAWVATVTNLDWPSSPTISTEQKKQEAIALLDGLKSAGVNTIIFQIRTECDAFYSSAYDPWSYWLTGSQGNPPYPYFDPLEFWIDEAHKRGMELHAWFNPYRAERNVGNYPLAPNHVVRQHPNWVLTIGTFRFLNPGLQEVRNYISNVIYDVVSRYDVDGVHFDDYFYPYPPNNMTANSTNNALDDSAFAADPRGFTNKEDWRRDNVNIMIAQVNNRIQSVKPWVKFGISPFGIWRPGYPPGITGMDAYATIYADALAWLRAQSIDYLTPQLYWPFGGGQDYAKLQPWWSDSVFVHGRHYYPGHALYRVDPGSGNWTASEIPNQIRFDRANPKVHGGVFFRAKSFISNFKGVTDTLKNDLYRYPAILPVMNWKDVIAPNPPRNLRFEKLANGQAGLKWDVPLTASDGDTAMRYVVYRFETSNIQPGDLENSSKILSVEFYKQSIPGEPPNPAGPYYFVVTALDRNYNESQISNVLYVAPPAVPTLLSPTNGAANQKDTVVLIWNYPDLTSSFRIQISTDPTFSSGIILDQSGLADSFKVITGLQGLTTYYWRVNSSNAGGASNFSPVFSFTTGFPQAPSLYYPPNNTGEIPTDTILYWYSTNAAQSYQLMVARGLDFAQNTIVVDTIVSDTTYHISGLLQNTFYFWRVKAINQYGRSNWSTIWRFKTKTPVSVEDEDYLDMSFRLEQNYPNPFNPGTVINWQSPVSGRQTIKLFDVLGREIETIVDEYLEAGHHSKLYIVKSTLPSGVYFYRLTVGEFHSTKKMILLR
jgi:uncharacterized lipoprotein YddW (UPF0748 family)